jgi:hypothetical protein
MGWPSALQKRRRKQASFSLERRMRTYFVNEKPTSHASKPATTMALTKTMAFTQSKALTQTKELTQTTTMINCPLLAFN